MKKIRLLNISFNALIKSYEIPAFRGAIIEKAGKNNELFHNHKDDQFNYRYPLIQYKTIAQKPAILCIEEGVDEIHHYFQSREWNIEVSGRKLDMSINQMNLNTFTMQVWDKSWDYSLRNWIALNQKNYKKYQEIGDENKQMKFLEDLLTGNILSFAKGIGWNVDRTIEVKIKELHNINKVKLKGTPVLGFNLDFQTNVFLPNHIGLGKGVSHGYGVVKMKKK